MPAENENAYDRRGPRDRSLRVGDREREAVAAILRRHHVEGREPAVEALHLFFDQRTRRHGLGPGPEDDQLPWGAAAADRDRPGVTCHGQRHRGGGLLLAEDQGREGRWLATLTVPTLCRSPTTARGVSESESLLGGASPQSGGDPRVSSRAGRNGCCAISRS